MGDMVRCLWEDKYSSAAKQAGDEESTKWPGHWERPNKPVFESYLCHLLAINSLLVSIFQQKLRLREVKIYFVGFLWGLKVIHLRCMAHCSDSVNGYFMPVPSGEQTEQQGWPEWGPALQEDWGSALRNTFRVFEVWDTTGTHSVFKELQKDSFFISLGTETVDALERFVASLWMESFYHRVHYQKALLDMRMVVTSILRDR